VVTHQLQVERRTAKERWPETDILPLSHVVGNVTKVSIANFLPNQAMKEFSKSTNICQSHAEN